MTIHYIDAGIDTGNILLREVVVFESGETLRSTNEILMTRARNLFLKNAQKILSGQIQSVDKSSESNNSFYHSRTISEYFVELLPEGWDTPVEYVESLGRDFIISRRFIEMYHDCIKK